MGSEVPFDRSFLPRLFVLGGLTDRLLNVIDFADF
jgi:hypothetical protein